MTDNILHARTFLTYTPSAVTGAGAIEVNPPAHEATTSTVETSMVENGKFHLPEAMTI